MTKPTTRPFEPDDLPAMQRVRRAAFGPIFNSFREIVGPEIAAHAFGTADAEQAKLLDDMCARDSAQQVVVALIGGEVIGFVGYKANAETGVGEIGLNAVHPAHAGKGVGTRLYLHVMLQMKEMGMKVASVGTGGDPSHAAARRAYEKAGFGPSLPSLYLYKLL